MTGYLLDERGYFWWADDPVPGGHFAPESAVTGQIQVSPNGVTKLILDDVLPRAPGRPDLNPGGTFIKEQQLAVVGLIKKGQEYVRIEQLATASYSFGSAQRTSESLKARLCVQGHRLISDLPPNRYCTSIRLSLAGFEEWLQLHPARLEKNETDLTVCFPQSPERTFRINDATITVGIEVDYGSGRSLTEITLRQEGYITYTPRLPMTLDDVCDTVRKLEDLLVLLTNCERTLGFPQVRVNGNEDWNKVTYETLQRVEKEISRSDLWTTFPHLSASFGEIVNAWFTKSAEFGPAFHLYLGNRRGMQLYIEHRFANFVWGLEAFHRNCGAAPRNTALSEKIERILSAVDKADYRWLARRLKYAHEPNLAQRILEVLASLPFEFDQTELKAFANTCATERNLISHFGGRSDGGSYVDHLNTWALLSHALDPLYHARILQELGFTGMALRQIFWDSFPASQIREVLARNGLNIPLHKPNTQ